MDDGEPGAVPRAGMVISVRSREDVVVVDPERFLAAARRAHLADHPDADPADIADVYDAVHALLDRYGSLGSDHPEVAGGATTRRQMSGGVGWLPGDRVPDRPDGLSPAGTISEINLDVTTPLQDHGCFLPEDQGA
ncbi:hypothetical protein BJY16_000167 [Actinoplanes octamycinicus]|uniref:Uncharacterized protein n=1 Tax=Actinoplanes octamycinicus TaxID=135948 RepID=A0A7W7GR05_9ACTN|nr:hypothetical protein [Actinoplanes octamycinicus]MBB4736708.1 hypothetical protein [Actinoplanes octamycinicus]GIE60475.1 hypothetical protein Aoc01nite_58770 [Actinoplanes octamycinicus]